MEETVCPGCGLQMPHRPLLTKHSYYNVSAQCWSVYTEVLAAEYSNAVLFGQVHQITVDTYSSQHAGGVHPHKSIDIHLAGLHLVTNRGLHPTAVAPLLQRLAESVRVWPHFTVPSCPWELTIADVAMAASAQEHADLVRRWSVEVWSGWAHEHDAIAAFVDAQIPSTA
jgi:hypothetical protein